MPFLVKVKYEGYKTRAVYLAGDDVTMKNLMTEVDDIAAPIKGTDIEQVKLATEVIVHNLAADEIVLIAEATPS